MIKHLRETAIKHLRETNDQAKQLIVGTWEHLLMRRAASVGLLILASTMGLAGCGSSQPPLSSAASSVLAAANFTMVQTTFQQTGNELRPVTNTIVINKPDRMALVASSNIRGYQSVTVGSTVYNRCPGKWIATRFPNSEVGPANEQTLWLLQVIGETTDVDDHGETYVVPPKEAARLLRSSNQIPFQTVEAKHVSLSATVQDGLLRTVTLYANAEGSVVTDKLTITQVGTSPTITAPSLPKGSRPTLFQGGVVGAVKLPSNPCSAG